MFCSHLSIASTQLKLDIAQFALI